MIMKDIYKAMEDYVKKGNFKCVLSKGFPEYLAKEVNITVNYAMNLIEDYCSYTFWRNKEKIKYIRENADFWEECISR